MLQYLIPVDLCIKTSINSHQGSMAIMVNPHTVLLSEYHHWKDNVPEHSWWPKFQNGIDRFWNIYLLWTWSEIHWKRELFPTVHVSIEYVLDTTQVIQWDDVPSAPLCHTGHLWEVICLSPGIWLAVYVAVINCTYWSWAGVVAISGAELALSWVFLYIRQHYPGLPIALSVSLISMYWQ